MIMKIGRNLLVQHNNTIINYLALGEKLSVQIQFLFIK